MSLTELAAGVSRAVPLLGPLAEQPFSRLLQRLEAPASQSSFLPLPSQPSTSPTPRSSHRHLSESLLFSSSLFKDSVITLSPSGKLKVISPSQAQLMSSLNSICIFNSPLPITSHSHPFRGLGRGYFGGPFILQYSLAGKLNYFIGLV